MPTEALSRLNDWELQISRGLIGGHSGVHKFGHNETVGTTAEYYL